MKRIASVLLSVIIILAVSVTGFSAKDRTFFANKTKVTVSKSTFVTITSLKGGALSCKVAKASVCSAKWGSWNGSKIKLKITAKKSGKTKITVTNTKTKAKLSIAVTVKAVKAKKISLSKKKLEMKKGGTATLKCTVSPSSVTNAAVSWTSSNKTIATVSSKGKVTAKKSGIVTITAKTKDGSKLKASCTVIVRNKTLDSKVKSELERLKNYILQYGDENSYGEKGLFGEDEDTIYSIRYLPNEKMFVFGSFQDYTEIGEDFNIRVSIEMKYSLTGFDYCTAESVNTYNENGRVESSYSADINIKTADYNMDSTVPTIKVKSNTYDLTNAAIKEYVNTDFKKAMLDWNNLLYDEYGMTLNDLGFKNF